MRSIDRLCVFVCEWKPVSPNKSHPYGLPNARTNQNVSEKPIINAEEGFFLRASKDNKVCLRNQNHMGQGDDAYRGSSNNKLLAAVNMAECEAHMSFVLSQSNRFTDDFHAKILHTVSITPVNLHKFYNNIPVY